MNKPRTFHRCFVKINDPKEDFSTDKLTHRHIHQLNRLKMFAQSD